MIKIFTNSSNQEVGAGGRAYYRSAEQSWPVLSDTSSVNVYINHNLGTRCVKMSMLAWYNSTSYYYPY